MTPEKTGNNGRLSKGWCIQQEIKFSERIRALKNVTKRQPSGTGI